MQTACLAILLMLSIPAVAYGETTNGPFIVRVDVTPEETVTPLRDLIPSQPTPSPEPEDPAPLPPPIVVTGTAKKAVEAPAAPSTSSLTKRFHFKKPSKRTVWKWSKRGGKLILFGLDVFYKTRLAIWGT